MLLTCRDTDVEEEAVDEVAFYFEESVLSMLLDDWFWMMEATPCDEEMGRDNSQTHSTNLICLSGALYSMGFFPQAISNVTTPKLNTSDSLLAFPVTTHSGAISGLGFGGSGFGPVFGGSGFGAVLGGRLLISTINGVIKSILTYNSIISKTREGNTKVFRNRIICDPSLTICPTSYITQPFMRSNRSERVTSEIAYGDTYMIANVNIVRISWIPIILISIKLHCNKSIRCTKGDWIDGKPHGSTACDHRIILRKKECEAITVIWIQP
ncbi:hypothetical protein Ccrd_019870 [Cynara cardunculus var. scolymus]|uniref:Uncharacterized protein n=1 Tax=Cynara cardunculus var. scolymus TaxID=59895 RepID=A0A103Y3I3_CYNCS|nr:hypothetical protein Ccrd_019870 [Cynara cardunculus var. scolymus]